MLAWLPTFVFWSDFLSFLQISLTKKKKKNGTGAENNLVIQTDNRLLQILNISEIKAPGCSYLN